LKWCDFRFSGNYDLILGAGSSIEFEAGSDIYGGEVIVVLQI
jgi:hypothetical protein